MVKTLFDRSDISKRNSVLLILFFFIFVALIGWLFGELSGWSYWGLGIAASISTVMIFVNYYHGDKIVLSISGAKLVSKNDYPHLFHTVDGLSIAAGIPKPKLYVINSNALNAFATGRDPKHASIAITKGLINRLNRKEVEGVISHEMSHIKNYDIRFMTLVSVLVGIVTLLSEWFVRMTFWGGNRNRKSANGVLMIIGLVLMILAPFIGLLIKFSISRKREFLADADGALLTRYPEGLASALEKISKDGNELKSASNATAHMFISNPFKKKNAMVNLFSTHPSVKERIKALMTLK